MARSTTTATRSGTSMHGRTHLTRPSDDNTWGLAGTWFTSERSASVELIVSTAQNKVSTVSAVTQFLIWKAATRSEPYLVRSRSLLNASESTKGSSSKSIDNASIVLCMRECGEEDKNSVGSSASVQSPSDTVITRNIPWARISFQRFWSNK